MITLIFCLRRRPDLSFEDFDRYWRETHGPLVQARAGALRLHRYVQSPRVETPFSAPAARSRDAPPAYDGLAQASWRGAEDLAAAFQSPEGRRAAQELIEDERRFIDLAASPIFFTEDRVFVADGVPQSP